VRRLAHWEQAHNNTRTDGALLTFHLSLDLGFLALQSRVVGSGGSRGSLKIVKLSLHAQQVFLRLFAKRSSLGSFTFCLLCSLVGDESQCVLVRLRGCFGTTERNNVLAGACHIRIACYYFPLPVRKHDSVFVEE
jgi:hypothetical protein